jgi:hypothetical protein
VGSRGLQHGDIGSRRVLKINSIKFLMETSRSASLPDDDAITKMF